MSVQTPGIIVTSVQHDIRNISIVAPKRIVTFAQVKFRFGVQTTRVPKILKFSFSTHLPTHPTRTSESLDINAVDSGNMCNLKTVFF